MESREVEKIDLIKALRRVQSSKFVIIMRKIGVQGRGVGDLYIAEYDLVIGINNLCSYFPKTLGWPRVMLTLLNLRLELISSPVHK
jgi:hypothetical protein